jgi:hypothetical protein
MSNRFTDLYVFQIVHNLIKFSLKHCTKTNKTNKIRGFSSQANYTDRAIAACRWS